MDHSSSAGCYCGTYYHDSFFQVNNRERKESYTHLRVKLMLLLKY